MSATYTIDASVFLNAFNPYEDGHEQSHALLAALQQQARPIIVPTLLLPELSASIVRGHRDAKLARDFCDAVASLPHVMLVPLDATLARLAVIVAADHRLRGSDAVYAAVAMRFGSTLVTLDKEQRERTLNSVRALSPAEALEALV